MQYKKQIVFLLFFLTLCFFGKSFALTSNFYTENKYAWQWPISSNKSYMNASFRDPSWARSTWWMKWNFSNEIWVKWKKFTVWKSPDIFLWWNDINWDGKEDVIYWYGWKLFLWDVISGTITWETWIYWVNSILWVEDIVWDGSKSIIVLMSTSPYYLAVINWKTWYISWSSAKLNGPSKNWYRWPDIKKYDLNNDGINEYFWQAWQNSFFAVNFYLSWTTVLWKTYLDTSNSWNNNNYIQSPYAIWTFSGSLQLARPHNDNYAYYSFNDLQADWYTMNPSGRVQLWALAWGNWNPVFYDFNWDGNDEIIWNTREQSNNGRKYTLSINWLNSSGSITSYWSHSEADYWQNFSNIFPLRDYSGSWNHVLIAKWKDNFYTNDNVVKYFAFSYKWLDTTNTSYKSNYLQNESFNKKVLFTYNWSQWDILGLFNNGSSDYVVLDKWWKYWFYKYKWVNTFNTWTTNILTWSYFNFFQTEWNIESLTLAKNFYSVDTNWNWLKEFVVTNNNYIKFYEISDTSITLIKQFWPFNIIPNVKKWGITKDKLDIYALSYDSTLNTVNYWRTDSQNADFTFTKRTIDTFYWWWATTEIRVSKLNNSNKIMFSYDGNMYDAKDATPVNPLTKIADGLSYDSVDIDWDWINEVLKNGKSYTVQGDYSLVEKYSTYWIDWDWNWDWVLDNIYECWSYPEMYYCWRDGKTWAELFPRTYYGNRNWCYSNTIWVWHRVWTNNYDSFVYNVVCWPTLVIDWKTWVYRSINNNDFWAAQVFDVNNDWKQDSVTAGRHWLTANNFDTTWTYIFNVPTNITKTWEINSPASFWNINNKVYIARVWLKWELEVFNGTNGNTYFFATYFNWKKYLNPQDVLDKEWLITSKLTDALVWDFIWNDTAQVLIWWNDGYVYIVSAETWDILKMYNIGTSIKFFIHSDVNNDWILDILLSSEDWYIYQLTNSNLAAPSWVKDWPNYWFDIKTQTLNDRSYVNFARNIKAVWYFIQLYNKTEKSAVFDWVDVWNKTKACIISSNYGWVLPLDCFKATKTFSLNGKSQYVWRVMAYNTNVSSAISESNWFGVLRVDMDKKVAIKENMVFWDENTVPPNTLLTYRIRVWNDSLNVIGWPWYMNYDMNPALEVANCTGITDCRPKNLVISDYMPSTFTYIPNSTVFIVRSSNMGYSAVDNIANSVQKLDIIWNEAIISGWDQVSDSYFKNQPKTTLSSNPWATLIWEFPSSIYIPPQWVLEIQFDAIARK